MKRVLLFFVLLGLSSCEEKSPDPEPSIYTGEATAFKNGAEWSASVYFDLIPDEFGNFLFRANVYNEQGFWRETLSVRRIRLGFDVQVILSKDVQNADSLSSSYGTLIDDGDVAGDIYELNTEVADNYIQITSVDSTRLQVSGIFNVSFVLSRKGNDSIDPPEEITLSNGTFSSTMKKEWFE